MMKEEELMEKKDPQIEQPRSSMNIGKDVLNLAETFGIKKSDLGKAFIKIMLGKDITGFIFGREKNEKRSKFERTMAAIKELMIPVMVFYMVYTIFRAWCAFKGVII